MIRKIQSYLETPAAERNVAAGALLLLQIDGNRIFYDNVRRRPERYADMVEYKLKRKLEFFLADLTHAQVEDMAAQVAAIAEKRHLTKNRPSLVDSEPSDLKKGKRADHDKLPPEIQQLYTDQLTILQQMRALHERLCIISEAGTPQYCPDSDRYPFLKELIALDKTYRANWNKYDNYQIEN